MIQYMESVIGFIIIIYVLVMTDTMASNFDKKLSVQQKEVEFKNYQIDVLRKKLESWKTKYETDMNTLKEQTTDELIMCNERIDDLEEMCEKYKKYQRKVIIDDSSEEDEIVCLGCLQQQPNQESHIGLGGCMNIDHF